MWESEPKFRMAVQHAAKNKVASGDGRVERKAQNASERERRGARPSDYLQGMQKNGEIERFDAVKNRLEERVIEIAMIDVRAHVYAPQAGHFGRTIQFIDGTIRKKHREGQQSDEPRRILQVRGTGRVVPCARQFVRDFLVAPMRHGSGQR